jgi:gamma-glutamyl hydrolase
MLGQVNAVLFTGGELHLQFNLSYVLVAQHIVRHAIQSKDHFPLWFTCMGFQMISAIIAEDIAVIKLNQFDSEGLALNLEITEEGRLNSRMLRGASEEMINVMINQPVTSNLHHDGVLPESFENNQNLKEFFRVISLNKDRKGTPFVSTIEGRNVPLYGVQWHPERPQFDWTTDFSANQRIPHESITVPLMQYFANFFVSEARRNDRKFSSFEAEQNALLFNYPAKFLGDSTLVYMFPPFSRDQ